MAKTPLQIITLRAPNLATDPNVGDYIELAGEQVGTVFCSRRNEAIALVAMHMMMITKNSDGGNNSVVGSITMEKEGQLMRQYGSVHNNSGKVDPYWSQTPFGLEYEAMKKGMVFSARTRMMGNIECNG